MNLTDEEKRLVTKYRALKDGRLFYYGAAFNRGVCKDPGVNSLLNDELTYIKPRTVRVYGFFHHSGEPYYRSGDGWAETPIIDPATGEQHYVDIEVPE